MTDNIHVIIIIKALECKQPLPKLIFEVWCWIRVVVFAIWKLRVHLIYFLIAHLLGLVGQLQGWIFRLPWGGFSY